MEKFRRLTPHDLAFGIGRKATDEELREMLNRAKQGESKDAMVYLKEIKERLAERRLKKDS